MSYDIQLVDPVTKLVIELDEPHQLKGGTYALGGTCLAHLNVTYNYGEFYYKHIDSEKGIRVIYGMTGKESIPVLQKGIDALKDDVTDNYWDSTEGNARKALLDLIELAKMCPDGIWEGD